MLEELRILIPMIQTAGLVEQASELELELDGDEPGSVVMVLNSALLKMVGRPGVPPEAVEAVRLGLEAVKELASPKPAAFRKRRVNRFAWTAEETELLLRGIWPEGRSYMACMVRRSNLKACGACLAPMKGSHHDRA